MAAMVAVAGPAMVIAAVLATSGLTTTRSADADEPETRVIVNGKPVPVFFNDGDSFRVVSGAKKGVRARLAGFNTLETHGPVHQWGSWHAKELYFIAKMATLHARRGVWTCETEWKLDTYGRTLMRCQDLGEELIRLGYAHALSIDDSPADAGFLAAQKEAMAARRGIWAHGVPPFVITSLHSSDEDSSREWHYNRLVSTEDGHSITWNHRERYAECQKVCQPAYPVNDNAVATLVAAVRADPRAAPIIAGLSEDDLNATMRFYAQYRRITRVIAKDKRIALMQILQDMANSAQSPLQGALTDQPESELTCMIYTDFKRRFGTGKAACLR
ncbi:MAG: thermonuclease family protein [Myxococcota bacterium]